MSRSLKKGPFVDTPLLEKIEAMNRGGEKKVDQDLVAPLDGRARDGRAHARRAQREEVHPGVRHREHGRPQARRVRADAAVQGAHDQEREGRDRRGGGAGARRRPRRRPGAHHDRGAGDGTSTSGPRPRRPGWCSISSAAATSTRRWRRCSSRRKGVARRRREGAAVGDRQRAAEGRVRRRRRPAVRRGVLRGPGAVDEADPAGADGTRVPRREADGAPDRARWPSGRRPRWSRLPRPSAGRGSRKPAAAAAREGGRRIRQSEDRAAAQAGRGGEVGFRRGEARGSESSPVRIPARLQQDLAVAVVRRPRLREAAARGPGAQERPEEAVRARGRLEDRDRARGQQAEDRHPHLAARASSSAARARRSTS